MVNKPYIDKQYDRFIIRSFNVDLIDPLDLKWHFDEKSRIIEPLNDNDWEFQYNDKLPIKLDKILFIESGSYHRLIIGSSNLKLKILEV